MKSERSYLAATSAVLLALSACSDDVATGADGAPAASADKYGVDGVETVNGVTFVTAQSVFDHYAKGDLFCYDFRFDDNTCESITYTNQVRQGVVELRSYSIEKLSPRKQVWPFRLELKGKYLCYTATEADIDGVVVYASSDRKAKIGMEDFVVPEDQIADWRAASRRRLGSSMGVEKCYRYSLYSENGKPVPGAIVVHEFIDGFEQPDYDPVPTSMFVKEERDVLTLRPPG